MKKILRILCLTIAPLAVIIASSQLAGGAPFTWSGASGSDLNWITPGNWSPAGPPGAADDAQFFDDGATNDAVSPDNIVSADIAVQSFWYGQTNGFHNTLINPGVTLTLSGANSLGHALLVGTENYVAIDTVVNATVSGTGGMLAIDSTNADLFIRQTFGSSGSHSANLDLSGLDSFTANLGRVQVGAGNTSLRRATGNLTLALTNILTLTGASPQLLVSDNSGNNNGNSTLSSLTLGTQNSIFADTIRIGGQKCSGAMNFGSQVSSLYLRGSDGVSRVSEIDIGDDSSQSGSGNPSHGTVDLSNGTADILADTIYLGRGQHSSGSGGATGILTLGAGTLDVNTLEVGYQNAANANASATISGTITVGSNGLFSAGATLIVNSNLDLGHSAGAAAPISSTLNIGGGTVDIRGAVSFAGAVNVNVTNSVLTLPPNSSLPANTVTVDGGMISNVDVLQASNSLLIVNGGVISNPKVFDMSESGSATWDLSQTPSGGLTVSNELSGAGVFYGNLTMASGSTLVPGGDGGVQPLGFVNDLNLNGATLRFDLSDNTSPSDLINVGGNLTLGATNNVEISPLSGSLDTVNPYTLIALFGGTLTGDGTYFQVVGPSAQSRYTFTFSTVSGVQLTVGGNGPANLLWTGDGTANNWDVKTTANWSNGGSPDKFYNLDNVTFDDSGSASPAVNLMGTLFPGSITMNNNSKAYMFAGAGGFGGGSVTNYGS
ncbi:MAG: hypothetical protein ACREFE_16110, partial [Limisphaerales bacterium]